jgi:hypothetical protein
VLWGLAMAQYFFAVRANSADTRERAAELKDNAAALAYALQMARELVPNSEGGSLVKSGMKLDRSYFRSRSCRPALDLQKNTNSRE